MLSCSSITWLGFRVNILTAVPIIALMKIDTAHYDTKRSASFTFQSGLIQKEDIPGNQTGKSLLNSDL